jgi:phosphatidylserine/phosphatidylglycerophosphate/cardiolipin synthase-like enzyme
MRKKSTSGSLTVRAIAGTHVVLLGMSIEPGSRKGLRGFSVERSEGEGGKQQPLPNFLLFEDNAAAPQPDHSSVENPFQAFQWCDYAAMPGRKYTYTVTARYGKPKALKDGDAVEIEVKTEDPEKGRHGIFFNRGAAGWQAYQRQFGERDPDQVPDRAGYRWLSRGLEEALLAFIAQAEGKGWGLRAAFYEFNYVPVLDALWSAEKRKVDVKIVVDEVDNSTKKDPIPEPRTKNLAAIDVAEIKWICTPRTDTSEIPHNKFIVLLKDKKPVEVWTGSTNITKGGIFGHSNVGHIVRDEEIAAAYLEYWKRLAKDPDHDVLQSWNVKEDGLPEQRAKAPVGEIAPDPDSISTIFSPREELDALEWYAKLMDNAQESVFLTAPFGVSDQLHEIFAKDKDYPRYLILDHENKYISPVARDIEKKDLDNKLAVGAYLGEGGWHQWLEEHLTGFNHAVLFIHTKYMLIDALGEDPIVITGSANFSESSITGNDENALVIRGDTAVADVYVSEFMRLFTAFRLRRKANAKLGEPAPNPANTGPGADEPIYLDPSDGWADPFYVEGSVTEKERLLFSGAGEGG